MAALLKRIYTAFVPPQREKREGAIRFGVLGAAKATPLTLIIPAKSHPEVIVQAVAARERSRAEAFAKSHGISDVKDSYQEIIDDPTIDAVLVPLPNSLHLEWAARAIRAGKHVLLEKPSTSNATEAASLFNLTELSAPDGPVLLEAFHNRFHPAVHKFLSFIDPSAVEHVYTDSMVPFLLTAKDNIEFNYELAGGSMMMLGTYNFSIIRMVFKDEPVECIRCDTSVFSDGVHDRCDYDFHTTFRFPNGGLADASTTLRGPLWWKPSEARVSLREVVIPDELLSISQEKRRQRQVTLHGYIHAIVWHRIDVKDQYIVYNKRDGSVAKKWTETQSHKAYTFEDAGGDAASAPGDDWWMSYRFQLEAFVNRVKHRPTQHWIDGQDSINQMKMIDMAYAKSGLGLRPTSAYR